MGLSRAVNMFLFFKNTWRYFITTAVFIPVALRSLRWGNISEFNIKQKKRQKFSLLQHLVFQICSK